MGVYHNGSDMLLIIEGNAIGHCTTHSVSFSSESKDRAVKPLASVSMAASSKWKSKSVTGLSVSVSGEGLIFSGETESSYAMLMGYWAAGNSVTVQCYQRGSSDSPYMTGEFVITSLERTDPAEDDSTYSIQLENDGAVTFDTSAFNDGTEALVVAAPVITPATETFSTKRTVTMTCATNGAEIYYTNDGATTPTSSATKYTAPFDITSTTTLKAIALLDGSSSAVTTKTYTKS